MCGKFVTNSVTSVTILKRTFNKLNHCNTCQPNQNVIFSCFSLEIDYLSFKIALLLFYPLFKQKRIQSEIPPPKRTPALLILVRVSGSKKRCEKNNGIKKLPRTGTIFSALLMLMKWKWSVKRKGKKTVWN